MKTKMYVLAALLIASIATVMADGTIIHPSSGSGTADVAVNGYSSTSTHLYIDHSKFADAVPGNEIHINGWNVQPGAKLYIGKYIEGEGSATPLPGSDFRIVTSLPVSIYLTEDMIAAIGNNDSHEDFRIYGENMTLNCVTLFPGKAGALKFGKTIWTGNFGMDSWTTLEMFKEAFNGIDLSKYRAIRFYHDANRTDFVMNIIQAWDPEVKIADQSNMTKTNEYFELPLDETMRENFTTFMSSGEGTLKIQCNKESGAAFHLTDVVLLPISPEGCDNCFYVY